MNTAISKDRIYYPSLDILRGIAILLVFLSHTLTLFPFEFGWVGVDLFFVLSGFLITNILIETRHHTHYFRNFYIRRALRIFPLYYLFLLFYFYITPNFFSNKYYNSYVFSKENQVWFWTHIQNWLVIIKGMNKTRMVAHFWSLAVEEQFYLVWPLIIPPLMRFRKPIAIIGGLIVLAILTRTIIWVKDGYALENYYCNTISRFDSILCGCLIAIYQKQGKKLSLPSLVAVLVACTAYIFISVYLGRNLYLTNPYFATVGYTVIALFFAMVIYIFINYKSTSTYFVKKLSLLSYIGKISYGMYIFHLPIHLLLGSYLNNYLLKFIPNHITTMLLASLTSLLLTILLSTISYFYFEKPIMVLKKHFS